jgi:hypothetical protein
MAILTNGVYATAINFSNATRAGKTFYWTNASPFSSNVRFTNTSGTNVFLLNAVGVLNTTVSNGIIVGRDAMPSSGFTNIMRVDSVVRTPIFRSWAADLALLQSIEGTNAANTQQLTNALTWHRTNTPATDIVLCGTYPVPSTIDDVLGQNAIMRQQAQLFGASYFDGWNVFGSGYSAITNVSIPRGFATTNADVHYTVEGMDTYGYFLSRWLGLEKLKFIPAVTNDRMAGWLDVPLNSLRIYGASVTPKPMFQTSAGTGYSPAPFYATAGIYTEGTDSGALKLPIPHGLGWTSAVHRMTWQIPANQTFTNYTTSIYIDYASGRTIPAEQIAHIFTSSASAALRDVTFTNSWPNDTAHREIEYRISVASSNQVRYLIGWQWKPLN